MYMFKCPVIYRYISNTCRDIHYFQLHVLYVVTFSYENGKTNFGHTEISFFTHISNVRCLV